MRHRIKIALAASWTALCLGACSPGGERYVGAVWIQRDTTLVYVTQWWTNGGLLAVTEAGGLRLHRVDLPEAGPLEPLRLLDIDGDSVFCDQLLYRPEDSLLSFAYAAEGDCPLGRQLRAGTLAAARFDESVARDTAALLFRLHVAGAAFDSGIHVEQELEYEKLCLGARGCITP